jgi:twitching motility protein PilT
MSRDIDALLRHLDSSGGSDLHLAAGLEPRVRVSGALTPVPGWDVLSHKELDAMLKELAPPEQWRTFVARRDCDFAYGLPGVARFRVNYFYQHNGPGAVMRRIPERIRSLEELKTPPVIESFAHMRSGLVLVTGPTGSGKSTTLAAIIDKINQSYDRHIVTIEDPIEFLHTPKRALLSQREVGTHTKSFARALRAAIRQNPDVILVGEMRDHETIALAVTAAGMGALVFGTLHTQSAIKTIDRLIDSFPAEEQEQARVSLSQSLTGVVAQLLLPTADGNGRVASHEILVRTTALPNIIREGNTGLLASLIQNGRQMGMQTMDDSLQALLAAKKIRAEDAYRKAYDKARFESFVKDEA